MIRIRIFVSSPGDVEEERDVARSVVSRLQIEFAGAARLEPVLWEDLPLRASEGFQQQIPHPSEADIAVFLLWAKLGTPLPGDLTRPDGSRYASGTEFEFEDALQGFHSAGTPDLLVYRKTTPHLIPVDDEAEVLERLAEKRRLDEFVDRWFVDAEGSFTAAFHAFERPEQLEDLLEKHLRQLLEQRLESAADGPAAPALALWRGRSPFRGLAYFDLDHALVFCGRTRAVGEVLNALRIQAAAGHPFVLVVGMSGVGKSSLVRAGVIPRLTRVGVIEDIALWRHAVMCPSDVPGNPLEALARALLRESALAELEANGTSASELADLLREAPDRALTLVRLGLSLAGGGAQGAGGPAGSRLALVVDQLEELFTADAVTVAERETFVAALAALARSGLVWVLATLRSDYYAACIELPELVTLKEGAGQYDLVMPLPAEIGQMIRKPALMAGLVYEVNPESDESLDEVLRDAAARDPEALPLLEFTLERLYERARAGGRPILTFADYEELGGIEGALAEHAEAVLQELPEPVQAELPQLFAGLVGVGLTDDELVSRKRVLGDAVTPSPESRALVEALVQARLLVSQGGQDAATVLSVAHEALLRRWPRAQAWVAANRDFLRARARLAAAEALWREGDEADAYLVTDERLLATAEDLLAHRRQDLSPAEARFAEASLALAVRVRRKQRRTRLSVTAAAVLALLGLAAWWDLTLAEHTRHFYTFVRRWGVPDGVGPISADEAASRAGAFRIVRRGRFGTVLRVEYIGRKGSCPDYNPFAVELDELSVRFDPSAEAEEPVVCTFHFEYTDSDLSAEKALDVEGNTVYQLEYITGRPGFVHYRGEGLELARRAASGAEFVQFLWVEDGPHAGIIREARFFDATGAPQMDAEGAFGSRVEEFDARGLPVRVQLIDGNGEPMRSARFAFAGMKIAYSETGAMQSMTILDLAQRPVLEESLGFATMKLDFDEHGERVGLAVYGPDGEPMLHPTGFFRATYGHDQWGNRIEEAFYGSDGELRVQHGGYARATYRYDERGNLIESAFYGSDGALLVQPEGFARATLEWDERGNLAEEAYYGATNQLLLQPEGSARAVHLHDEWGNRTDSTYFGEDGKPILIPSGYARSVHRYDEQGNLLEGVYYGPDGKLLLQPEGFARATRRYDERGNVQEEAFYGPDGKLLLQPEGYARVTYRYDERGNAVESAFYGPDGDFRPNQMGHARMTARYDERGHQLELAYFDVDGQPVLHPDGYARLESRVDRAGNPLEMAHYGVDGELVLHPDGYARITARYDGWGNQTELAYHGLDGEPIVVQAGFAGAVSVYDRRGNQLEHAFYGADGEAIVVTGLYSKSVAAYDDEGRLTEQTFYGADAMPMVGLGGYARRTLHYDERGRPVEEAYYGTDLELRRDGYAKQTMRYDENGNQIESAFFGLDGESVMTAEGYATATSRYDERGKQVELAYRGTAGEPIAASGGYATIRFRRDAAGNELERIHLGVSGKRLRVRTSVREVLEKSQAEQLGLRSGDTLVRYGGTPVADLLHFIELVNTPGEEQRELVVLRNDETHTFSVAPGKLGIRLGDHSVPADDTLPGSTPFPDGGAEGP